MAVPGRAAVGQQGKGQAVGFGKKTATGQGRDVAGTGIPLTLILNEFEGVAARFLRVGAERKPA